MVEAGNSSAQPGSGFHAGSIGIGSGHHCMRGHLHRLPRCHVDSLDRSVLALEAVRGLELVMLEPVRFGLPMCGSHNVAVIG